MLNVLCRPDYEKRAEMPDEESKSDKKEKKIAKRLRRLFEDIEAGAVLQVDRRITKVIALGRIHLYIN